MTRYQRMGLAQMIVGATLILWANNPTDHLFIFYIGTSFMVFGIFWLIK